MNLVNKIIFAIISVFLCFAIVLTTTYYTIPNVRNWVNGLFGYSDEKDNSNEQEKPNNEVKYETSSLLNFTPNKATDTEYFLSESIQAQNSQNNPYLIGNADDLRTLAYFVNTTFNEDDATNLELQKKYSRSYYKITNHIDLSKWTKWEPIGTNNNPFLGNLNGNGYSIYGLTIIDTNENEQNSYAGLFGKVSYYKDGEAEFKPIVQRLGLKDTVIVTNRDYVGAIVAFGVGAKGVDEESEASVIYQNTAEESGKPTYSNAQGPLVIQDCYNVGYVQGGKNVGGLAGALLYGAVVYNCYNAPMNKITYNQNFDVYSADIEANVGGLVGSAEYTTKAVVYKCFNSALVSRADVEDLIEAGSTNQISQSTSITNIGFIIGNKSFIGASSLYSTNIYVKYSYTFKGDYGFTENFSIMQSDFDLFNIKWGSIERYNADTWSSNSSKIWCMQPNVNNGLPVLYNVPQLIKVAVYAIDSTKQNTLNKDIVSAKLNQELIPASLVTYGGHYLYSTGNCYYVTASVKNSSILDNHIFAGWDAEYTADSIREERYFNSLSNLPTAYFFTNHDCVYYANFTLNDTCSVILNPVCKQQGFERESSIVVKEGSKNITSAYPYWNVREQITLDFSSNIPLIKIVELKVADNLQEAVKIDDTSITIDFAKLYEQLKTMEISINITVVYEWLVPELPEFIQTGTGSGGVSGSGIY